MQSRLLFVFAAAMLAVSAVAAVSNAAVPLPGNEFPITERYLFMSGIAGGPTGDAEGLLFANQVPSTQNRVDFVAPGVDVLGVLVTPSTQSWYTETSWDKALEVVDDSTAVLYFVANAQGIAVFEARLYDVAPDGTRRQIDSNEQQFVTALSPQPVEFPLTTGGLIVSQGHILQLEVFAQTGNAAVFLQYGGDTPSALTGLRTRWLDSDADGVPDSDELALHRNPLNPNDPTVNLKDSDSDGLADDVENIIGTRPNRADTDGDGFTDGVEVHAGTNPSDEDSVPYDEDGNGLPDSFESNYFNETTINGPGGIDPFDDPDDDGCNNLCEAAHGTDPLNPDSDSDGVDDGVELKDSTDPLNPSSFYVGPTAPEPVAAAAAFALGTTMCLIPFLRRT